MLESLSSGGNRFFRSDGPQEEVFEQKQGIQGSVEEKCDGGDEHGYQGVHPVMVCSGDDCNEDENRVGDPKSRVDGFLQGGFV